MQDSSPLLPALVIAAAAGAGVWLLRRSWQGKDSNHAYVLGGWALIAAAIAAPAWALGPARGPFIALALVSTVALALVAGNYTRRAAKARAARESLAPEPSDRATTKWRETLRWLLAGPIGMVAAMGVGIAWAALAPGEQQTRLVIGGLIVPVAWGACMAWTLADNRILRATAVLVGVAVASFSAAILKGFA
ncbi:MULTISPECIES: hypothetical protein [unclassified Sphingopyxis]|uniref:hypothetical protein n=1 Tax=unclassified Sphingopyxis TaxID=2614943 RepID=UPI000736F998|nr:MULTISPECIES: hypothetical protein [unclassified Sphingopyxis]KTE38057.1 hypothetical protein ATE62_11970 [Sphingopyxis sp. HIX]KTE84633.1 hypothetical protein ATE72_07780 [Sphingopyxis sp. HXXIV]